MNRRGSVLIVVAGIAALLVALVVAFLTRMRSDAEEMQATQREAQARLMLSAACDYVLEAARIGYDGAVRPSDVPADAHIEAYGWVDVRDGSTGPNRRTWRAGVGSDEVVRLYDPGATEPDGFGGSRPRWPAVGGVARCPMQVLERPPYAMSQAAVVNPISIDPADPLFGLPMLINPDPKPIEPIVRDDGTFDAAAYARYVSGDRRVRAQTAGKSWFRVLRDGPATFILTCGAGGTFGFRTWREVQDASATESFSGDPALWRAMADDETRLFFRVEWSPAVTGLDYNHFWTHENGVHEAYITYPKNASHNRDLIDWVEVAPGCQSNARNPVGTLRWIQRLRREPSRW